MIDHCLVHQKKFGICLPKKPFTEYGTVVEIERVIPSIDHSRYLISVVGLYRFRTHSWTTHHEGYYEATIERIEDYDIEEFPIESSLLSTIDLCSERIHSFAQGLLKRLPSSTRQCMLQQYGHPPRSIEHLTFYIAQLMGKMDKYTILYPMTLKDRLLLTMDMLNKVK
jgi:Lon protease-like protein